MTDCVAFPCFLPGGLKAPLFGHFGESEAFTVVLLRDGAVADVKVLAAPAHEHGGCMAPVRLLAEAGVTALVTAGIGGRPLQGCAHQGITAFQAGSLATVEEALHAWTGGGLSPFSPEMACAGGGSAHGSAESACCGAIEN
ncbi:dinitrogenase iron-molybdenum cofactor biosynthesis protein [Rhodospirillum rubrum]|uniref:NifB/NifX family molybdenum-iron cluster-binding protein n=1 Tax=Rhodospirillum rubrum TaxID=1085 RepID=UPI001904A000|nr:NifB/NifX family molybdenum-iron cluster-binding protein [Rhodospirillum rubrum]MBK1665343.1 dinitrogenase iron-molybdenum cofactor biosynthesis protein [Rhodospirillum rubrum]MBK1676871.1 dinitrogenase iron-molybdenum cofactor biosynthesis protein [Rhodospirillum rubrum]